jgi:ketosteroid isomerase-like protein
VSGEVADTARRYREALRTGDLETAVGLLHPDVELVLPRGTVTGVEEVRAYLAAQAPLEHIDVETHAGEVEPVDADQVRASTAQRWRWRESGDVAYERQSEARYTVRDGRIARVEVRHVT